MSNIIIVSYLNQELDLDLIYNLIPIFSVNYTVGNKIIGMKRETVPYFGIDKGIVGIRFKNEIRGIKRCHKHLKGIIGLDIQCFNKNINAKISKNNILLVGSNNEEMAIKTNDIILEHFKMLFAHINHIKSLKENIKETTVNYFLSSFIENKISKFDKTKKDIDCEMFVWLSTFIYEYNDINNLRNKITVIMDFINNTNELNLDLSAIDYKICNGVYDFNLGNKISLIKLSKELINLKYKVSYHNWCSGKKIKLVIPIDDNKVHKFTINQSGTVRQMSPTNYIESYKQHLKLYNDIQKIYSLMI
jgi:hypothetical protein